MIKNIKDEEMVVEKNKQLHDVNLVFLANIHKNVFQTTKNESNF